ncbi:LacI family DNA-binding transcriptional regulator [Corynebacterium glutamicum]|uniref:LacI family DNA-binding transcriptional regulator n=1 Tax=Corynebacterium glutamicum TaxID=1718 RepID=UPI0007449ED1|nr:LacI family DNA-binding transcriptional regulator [Corynebacterium glutamicum]ALZ98948.1 LacI family transcriptional regulator [Corynebacterium glutamicum]
MSTSRPTIYDVAKAAGVSKSLVSLVLRGSTNVSKESEAAVKTAIKKLNYQPNRAASDLAAKRTQLIAVLIDDYSNPWFIDLIQSLSDVLTPEGYRLSVIDSLTSQAGTDPITSALSMRPDGIIIAQDIPDFTVPDSLPPFVIAGTRITQASTHYSVANDDFRGAEIATKHLIDLGHTHIAHLRVGSGAGLRRFESFEATMRAHGLEPLSNDYLGPAVEHAGYTETLALLKEHPEVTAIFSSNDITAIGALGAARELGLRVPEDLSIIGYDNTPLAQTRLINLTTIDDNSIGVGYNAALLLLSMLDPEAPHPEIMHTLQPSLIERGTCAPRGG